MIKRSVPQKTEKSIMCMKKLSFIVRDFNIPSSVITRADKQKISKNKVYLNSMINHLDPISIGRLVYPNREEYTFFSRLHGTFSKINHITVHIKEVFTGWRAQKIYRELCQIEATAATQLGNTQILEGQIIFTLYMNQRNLKRNSKLFEIK